MPKGKEQPEETKQEVRSRLLYDTNFRITSSGMSLINVLRTLMKSRHCARADASRGENA